MNLPETFEKLLEEVLLNLKNSYDTQRNFFIALCLEYPNVFCSMFNLRNNKEYVLILLEGLKFIRDNCDKANLEHLKEQIKEIELKIDEVVKKINVGKVGLASASKQEHQPCLTE